LLTVNLEHARTYVDDVERYKDDQLATPLQSQEPANYQRGTKSLIRSLERKKTRREAGQFGELSARKKEI